MVELPTVTPYQWGDANQMFGLSQQLIQLTEGYVASIEATAANIFAPVINPNFPAIASPPTAISATLSPLIDVTWSTPAQPAPFANQLIVTNIMPGAFTGVAPTLNFGTAPGPFTGVAPAQPAINTAFAYPTVAAPTLPTLPPLMGINTVAFNPLIIPSFSVTVPKLQISPPNSFNYTEYNFYTSTELAMVQTSLSNAILNGTDTGLDASTQQAISDAAYEREYRAQANALAELERMASLGYVFPPGGFIDARIKLQTETMNTIAGLSRDIMISDKKLRLENVNKARELAVNLEHRLIEYYNQVCQRAFDAAKYAVESSIGIYNAQVEMFKGQLEGYRVQALVYETQIKGIEAQIEEYKAQIEFERTKAEINKVTVDAYAAQIEASLATLKVFEIETEIIKTQAEVEKLKIDTYSAQITAFVGTINAYTAQVESYKAGIEAQATVESAYKTSVDAYAAEVHAAAEVMDVQVATYKAQIEAYTAQLDGYKASLQAMTEQARAASLYNTAQVEVYKGEVSANVAYNEALITEWKAIVDTNERIAEVAVKAAEANGQLYISARQLSLDAAKTGAQVAAQLGAAALNAIHWSNSSNWSVSESSVSSISTSTSTSTNTNYNSSV